MQLRALPPTVRSLPARNATAAASRCAARCHPGLCLPVNGGSWGWPYATWSSPRGHYNRSRRKWPCSTVDPRCGGATGFCACCAWYSTCGTMLEDSWSYLFAFSFNALQVARVCWRQPRRTGSALVRRLRILPVRLCCLRQHLCHHEFDSREACCSLGAGAGVQKPRPLLPAG